MKPSEIWQPRASELWGDGCYPECYECADKFGRLEQENADLRRRLGCRECEADLADAYVCLDCHAKVVEEAAELRKQLETRKDFKSKREVIKELLEGEKQGKTHYSIHYFIDLLDEVETYHDENQDLKKQLEQKDSMYIIRLNEVIALKKQLEEYQKFENKVKSKEWELEAWCCDCDKEDMKREIEGLREQLANAIVPKFKIGQEVWIIHNEDTEIEDCKVQRILILQEGIRYDLDWIEYPENHVFATQAEALAALAKLKAGGE